MTKRKRILTGDRTTGKLHLGHYVGSLKSRVELQDEYETFILLADVQALTTHFNEPELISTSILDVAMDNLSVGLDPEKVTFVQQSQITSIAELTVFYSMIVSVNQLRHNPTIKTEAANYGYEDLSYGFLGYPVSQTADISFINADLVPVGEDQIPHIELTRKIIRKFNKLYGTKITVPRAKLSDVGRLAGLDGNAKMGKSMGNAIYLSDPPEVVWQHVRKAVTDTSRVHAHMEGHPQVCNVFKYHQAFNPQEADEICKGCTGASLSCFACKQRLNEVLNELLEPMRERRAYYEANLGIVRDLIHEGSKKANRIGNENLERIKEKMHILI